MMYEQSRTGVLAVVGADGPVEIHLKEGKVVGAVPPPGSDWLLGHVLVESGTVPEKKLYRLLRKHRKTGRPLEILLIEQGTLTRDVLGKYLDLQLRETLLPLFLQEEVPWDFRDEPPHVNDFIRPQPIPFLLKEAERRAKEWPVLRRLGLTLDQVYDKTDESIERFLLDESPDTPGGQLGAGERLAYYYVNGRKTVQQVSFASCLGEFETLRAIALLRRRGFVLLKERRGKGEEAEDPTILPRLVAVAFYLVLGALVAGLVLVQPTQMRDLFGTITGQTDVRSSAVTEAQEARIRGAIDLFFAWNGRYPASLSELATREILPASELARTIGRYRYEIIRGGYVLAASDRAVPIAARSAKKDDPPAERSVPAP